MKVSALEAPNFLFFFILLAILGMCAASAQPLFRSFMPATEAAAPGAQEPQAGKADDPASALTGEQAGSVSALMRKLQSNPNDATALMDIADIFIEAGEWARAEVFLTRAVLARPGDTRPRYMLGLAQHQAGKMAEAAVTFEELLSIKEDPAAMYNLAVIYKHHLNKAEEAQALLRRVLDSPSADMDTLDRANKEMMEKP